MFINFFKESNIIVVLSVARKFTPAMFVKIGRLLNGIVNLLKNLSTLQMLDTRKFCKNKMNQHLQLVGSYFVEFSLFHDVSDSRTVSYVRAQCP